MQAINQFCKSISRRSVALFYFSGHGVQLGGSNYVVPISAGAVRETHVEADLIDVGRLLAGMEAAQASLNMIILDACRNDPFQGRSFRSGSGLAPMQARSGTIISYATQPGNVALDGQGDNSPFALALLEVLQRPQLEALAAFNAVGILVRQWTGGRQVPWMTNSPVETRFVFNPGLAAETPQRPPAGAWWLDAAPTTPAAPSFVVSATRPGAYRTIQEAIDAAPENASISIEPGRYAESLRITKAVEVSAQGGVDETIIEKIEGDEEAMAVIASGPVSLRGLTFRTGVNCDPIDVLGGTVVIDDCTIERECAVPSDEERASGVDARGDGVDLTVQNCRIKGFRWGVYAADEARVVVDGCHIRSDWTREKESPCAIAGLWAESGASLEVREETSIESYYCGAVVVNGGQAHLSEIRIACCCSGIEARGEGASAVVEDCEVDDVDFGIRAVDGSRITVRACDISYVEAGIQASGGVVEVEQCKRISGIGASAWGVWASEGGIAELRGCRIFGGEVGLRGYEDGTIRANDCEIFDVSNAGGYGEAGSVLQLRSCSIHHCANHGFILDGELRLEKCTVHDNGIIGINCGSASRFSVKDCVIYRNGRVGVFCDDDANGSVVQCTILLNPDAGVALEGRSQSQVSLCIIRQNPNGAVWVNGQARATVEFCDLRRNLVSNPINMAKTAKLIQNSNHVDQPVDSVDTKGPGGPDNRLENKDFFFGELAQVIDLVEDYARENLTDWGREAPQSSPDGRKITYIFTKDFTHTLNVQPTSVTATVEETLRRSRGAAMFKTVDLPYEIRMTVTLAGEPAFAGMERVEVVVSAEEHIDRHHHARVDLVHHYSAPSFIYADQLGYKLLYHLGRRLTLA